MTEVLSPQGPGAGAALVERPVQPPGPGRAPLAVTGFTGPWRTACARLADALTARLAPHAAAGLTGLDVEVSALGARDELAVSAADSADPDRVPVRLYGHTAVVGPFPAAQGVRSSAGERRPCALCLARRWQAVRADTLRDAVELGDGTRAAGSPPGTGGFAADALAALVAGHRIRERAGGGRVAGYAAVYLVDLETLHVSAFPLVPEAECPRCDVRTDDGPEAARVVPESAPKPTRNTFRLRPIDAYHLPLEAFVNPVTGMLGPSVVPDLASASTSSVVGAFTTRSGSYLRDCFWGGHAGSYGTSVRVGVLEGLERFAGMRARARRTTVTASLDELGETALDPRVCGLYDDACHAAEPDLPRFDPSRPIAWVWGWSLRDERPVLIPEILAYYHAPGGARRRFVQESSNGCASGGSMTEAVLYGLMEAVERDAFLLAWYGRAPLPEIDPASSTRPQTRAMIDRLALYGYRARFFDTRVTFPIPVVTAVAERVDGGLGRMCFGAGAGLDPEAALAAGLCEIATDSVNLRRRTVREERRLRAMADDFDRVAVLHDHPLLYGLPEMAPYTAFLLDREQGERGERGERGADGADGDRAGRPMTPLTALASGPGALVPGDDLRDDLERCVAAVTAHGFDVLVVDQTSPEQRDLGFATARVMVPGLLPIDFGWRRQRARHLARTRTALRQAGLRTRDLRTDEINPAPHPFP